jgi:hypothetical protein
MPRCEVIYNPGKWPHAKRCSNEATVCINVDGEDMEVCPEHATEWEEEKNAKG